MGYVLILGIVIWAVDMLWHGIVLAGAVREGLVMAEGGFENVDLEQALPLLEKAQRNFEVVRRDLQPIIFVVNLAARVPGMGEYAGQVQPGLTYASGLVEASSLVARGLLPAWRVIHSEDRSVSVSIQLSEALNEGNGYFYAARAALTRSAGVRGQIKPDVLPAPWNTRFQSLDSRFYMVEAGIDALIALPDLLGIQQEKTYLLAALNDDELRGSGGFISGLGLLRVKDGDITHLTMYDSYILENPDVVYPAPPLALKEFMTLPVWLPRDANWSADFPQAARDLQDLYRLTTGEPVDGVIAIDTQAAGLLIDVLGPLEVNGAPQPVDAGTVQAWMRTAWEPEAGQEISDEWWFGRKDFMLDLAHAAISRVKELKDRQTLVDLLWTAREAVETGHLLIYLNHSAGQAALQRVNLDAGVHPGWGDFLMIVDGNIGFNKVNARIRRSAVYEVDLRDPSLPRAALAVAYTNPGEAVDICVHQAVYGETYADMQNRCYWNAWRILTAGGSLLEKTNVESVPPERLVNGLGWDGVVLVGQGVNATSEFAGVMVLPIGSEQTINLEWLLPKRVIVPQGTGWIYRLALQKQAGAANSTVIVRVQSPEGYVLSGNSPDWELDSPGVWRWEGLLDRQKMFDLVFQPVP